MALITYATRVRASTNSKTQSRRNNLMAISRTEVKLIPPSSTSRKTYPIKELYPSLFSKVTKRDREIAAKKGIVI